jgi:hypothetical protein
MAETTAEGRNAEDIKHTARSHWRVVGGHSPYVILAAKRVSFHIEMAATGTI